MSEYVADRGAQAHIDADASVMLARIGAAIETDAKSFVPVDTGALRDSIECEPPGFLRVRIVAREAYAAHVEQGTRHQAAQPYLSPALYRERVI